MNCRRASRLSENGPSPPLRSQRSGSLSQALVSAVAAGAMCHPGLQTRVESPGAIAVVMAGEAMVPLRPAGNLAPEECQRARLPVTARRLRAARPGRRTRSTNILTRRNAAVSPVLAGSCRKGSVNRQEFGEGVLDIFHLDGLGEHLEPIDGRKLLSKGALSRTEQDQCREGMPVLLGLVLHVDKCVDRLRPQAVESKMTASEGDSR